MFTFIIVAAIVLAVLLCFVEALDHNSGGAICRRLFPKS